MQKFPQPTSRDKEVIMLVTDANGDVLVVDSLLEILSIFTPNSTSSSHPGSINKYIGVCRGKEVIGVCREILIPGQG